MSKTTPNTTFRTAVFFENTPKFANNTAALNAGLTEGELYKTEINGDKVVLAIVEQYNFDITGDWTGLGVSDLASFILIITSVYSNFTNLVVTDFKLENNRLQCNLTAEGTSFQMNLLGLTQVLKIGNVPTLSDLDLASNELTKVFNFSQYPDMINIAMYSNLFTNDSYKKAEVWAKYLPQVTTPHYILFYDNIDTIVGTNLEAILTSKGWTVG